MYLTKTEIDLISRGQIRAYIDEYDHHRGSLGNQFEIVNENGDNYNIDDRCAYHRQLNDEEHVI